MKVFKTAPLHCGSVFVVNVKTVLLYFDALVFGDEAIALVKTQHLGLSENEDLDEWIRKR